jgi:signal peptidase II
VKKKLLIVSLIVAFILTLDQIIKIYVKTKFDAETYPVFGDWFVMEYTENQGMAFGTTFGSSIWAKLSLSIFRIIAIVAISFYLVQQARKNMKIEFLIAIGLILAGAAGNLIDSMFYDFIFPIDQYLNPTMTYNLLPGSGNFHEVNMDGAVWTEEIRHTGFLFGNVVDMFQFQGTWPSWVPWVGGSEVFPAIWNIADASITIGVVMVFLRQRAYFPKEKDPDKKSFFKRLLKRT